MATRRKCRYCHKLYTPQAGHQRYCSEEHRKLDWQHKRSKELNARDRALRRARRAENKIRYMDAAEAESLASGKPEPIPSKSVRSRVLSLVMQASTEELDLLEAFIEAAQVRDWAISWKEKGIGN